MILRNQSDIIAHYENFCMEAATQVIVPYIQEAVERFNFKNFHIDALKSGNDFIHGFRPVFPYVSVRLNLEDYLTWVYKNDSLASLPWGYNFASVGVPYAWGSLLQAATAVIRRERMLQALQEDLNFFSLHALDELSKAKSCDKHILSYATPEQVELAETISKIEEEILQSFNRLAETEGNDKEWSKKIVASHFPKLTSEAILVTHHDSQIDHVIANSLALGDNLHKYIESLDGDYIIMRGPVELLSLVVNLSRYTEFPEHLLKEADHSLTSIPESLSENDIKTALLLFKSGGGQMTLTQALESAALLK